jgi:hypothetical protein
MRIRSRILSSGVPFHAAAGIAPSGLIAVLQLVLAQHALLLLAHALPHRALPQLPLSHIALILLHLSPLVSLRLLIFLLLLYLLYLLQPRPILALPAKLLALLLLAPLLVVRSLVFAPFLVNVLELAEIVFERSYLVPQLLILD